MKLHIVHALVVSVFMLTTVSGFEPYIPDIDLTLQLVCNCIVGGDPAYCEVGGCEGTKECKAVFCIVNEDCGSTQCAIDKGTCTAGCQSDYEDCIDDCSWWEPLCEDACLDDKLDCLDGCQKGYEECMNCTGMWSSCEKVDPCCGVECEDNEECEAGSCICADSQERCLAGGTGDGVDNDCDGEVDEGCAACAEGDSKACTINSCPGTQTCNESGEWGGCVKNNPCCGVECESNQLCDASTGNCVCKDSVERCATDGTGDGVDNDCDGEVDEGCAACVPDSTQVCAVGACPGTQTCSVEGEWSDCLKDDPCCEVVCEENEECEAAVCKCKGTLELCGANGTGDGVDNDCDGEVDEGCTGETQEPAENETDGGDGTAGDGQQGGSPTRPQPGPGMRTQSSEVDMNLVIVLIIVVVIGIFALAGIKLARGGKKQPPAQQPPQ